MSICTFFLKPLDNPPNLEELKTKMSSNSIELKNEGVRDLIKCLAND